VTGVQTCALPISPDDEVRNATAAVLKGMSQNNLFHVFELFIKRCKKCIQCEGRYFEKEKIVGPVESSNSEFKKISLETFQSAFVNDSVEIPTRCSFVIEFIIPKFIEGSTCFEWHTAHHQELKSVFAASGLYTHVVTGRRRNALKNNLMMKAVSNPKTLVMNYTAL
jgi:hypothetical protein